MKHNAQRKKICCLSYKTLTLPMHDKGVPEIHNGKRLRFIPSEPDTVNTGAGIVDQINPQS